MTEEDFFIWTVYENPSDYPGKFVVRRWNVDRPTADVFVADTLEEARRHIPFGLIRMPRHDSDDAVIVESWL